MKLEDAQNTLKELGLEWNEGSLEASKSNDKIIELNVWLLNKC